MILSRSTSCPYCGDDHYNSCYIIYDDGDHCFSCGKGIRKNVEYFAYRVNNSQQNVVDSGAILPECVTDLKQFSLNVLEWLYKYYVYDELIKKYKIMYCEESDYKPESLIFPILGKNRDVIAYQRRFFPKGFFSSPLVKKEIFVAGQNVSNSICLVEDYISSIRVGEVINTLCLFGTSITSDQISFIINSYSNVKIWMDNDDAGIKASSKIYKKLISEYRTYLSEMAYGSIENITVEQIHNRLQPKECTYHEIRQAFEN